MNTSNAIINDAKIDSELKAKNVPEKREIRDILAKAKEMKGISYHDVLALLNNKDLDLDHEIFETSKWIKDEIYGNRLVIFAPLYISNLCNNECIYCAFRASNKKLHRKELDQNEIKEETTTLINQGHKRVLLVAGEAYQKKGLDYVLDSIDTVYSVQNNKGNIRRINVNIAPLTVDEFKRLHGKKIGTYQLFQETYHKDTYKKLHLKGPKANYDFRLEAMDRAFTAGFEDVGIGVLFGLYDWKYEILALLEHIHHLENKFGVGPHTISVPRIEPALGSDISYHPPHVVSDHDFKKIIAVLRMSIPYTGIILSTRESAAIRKEAFELGISQISAGSKTNPGGYHDKSQEKVKFEDGMEEQFSLGDTRSLMDVIKDMVDSKHIPSFCTGCYRRGRVGQDFMDLAKPGLIKAHCVPNAMFTFAEYLYDFADDELMKNGMSLINEMVDKSIAKDSLREKIKANLRDIAAGKRDIYY